jgi:hypothetical protein
MATDSSEPRVGLIAKVGVFSIVVLLCTRSALSTYFDSMEQSEKQRKIGLVKPEALMSLRASEATRLSSGAMPIDKAMGQLASRGRMGIGPEFAPSASRDVAPLQGWAKMPSEVPPAMMTSAAPVAPATPVVDGGAGAIRPAAGRMSGTDAGARHRALVDDARERL